MRYGAKSPAKRIILISVSCLVAVALAVTGIAVFMNARTANATVDVESVSAVSTMYWGDQSRRARRSKSAIRCCNTTPPSWS